MTADDNGRRPAGAMGFNAYADDTPRLGDDDADYRDLRMRSAIAYVPEPTFEDELAGDGAFGDPGRRRRAWPWGKAMAAGGVVLAVAAGLWLGRSTDRPDDAAVASAAAQQGPGLNVEVAKARPPTAPPPPTLADRLEVLPPAGGSAAPILPPVRTGPALVAQVAPPVERSAAPMPTLAPKPAAVADAPRDVAVAPPARDAVSAAPAAPAGFDCRDAGSQARAMVCGDPRLAALDRRMKRAYAAALDAGLPEDALREDQDDWLNIREDAARYSRAAVVNVYRQRIAELERAADEGR